MSKINTFFSTLVKTFTSPAYYLDILKARFSFSLKYFLVFFFLYAIVGTVITSLQIVPPVTKFLSVLPSRIESIYPQGLEIYLKDGLLSTNVPEPYSIPISVIEKAFSDQVLGTSTTDQIENILVIDTKDNAENFRDYKTVVLLTQKSLVTLNDDNSLKMYSFTSDMNGTLTKAMVSDLISKVAPYLGYVAPLMVGAIFLGLLISTPVYYLLYLLFFAFLFWILAKITKVHLTYSKSYQLGLHLCTITATLFGLLSLLDLTVSFPFAQTAILLSISTLILIKIFKPVLVDSVPQPPR